MSGSQKRWDGATSIGCPRISAITPGKQFVCVLILVACFAAAYPQAIALWRLSTRATLIAVAGCAIYVIGAAGLESVGYKMLSGGATPQLYRVEVAAEGFFEMLGGSLILYAVALFGIVGFSRNRSSRRWHRNINLAASHPRLEPRRPSAIC